MDNKKKNIDIESTETAQESQETDTATAENAAPDTSQEAQEEPETAEDDKTAANQTDENPLETARKQLQELNDKYLRTMAEFDNYRKRTLKEKTELLLNGSEKTVSAILPVLDDMERAVESAAKAESNETIEEGWELIFKKLQKVLEGLGVQKIDTQDADFNVDYHEAVAMVPGMGDDKKGKVIDCVQTGYMLNDKVIRHAKVAVGQ